MIYVLLVFGKPFYKYHLCWSSPDVLKQSSGQASFFILFDLEHDSFNQNLSSFFYKYIVDGWLVVGERSCWFVKWCGTFIEPLISDFCVSQTLPGNWNYYQVKRNVFHYAITAKHLRIYPMGWNTENGGKIGLRVELYGCPYGKRRMSGLRHCQLFVFYQQPRTLAYHDTENLLSAL